MARVLAPLLWLVAAAAVTAAGAAAAAGAPRYNLTVGYLTSVRGAPDRQGLAISGALTMALEEINNDTSLLPQVELQMVWEDTRGDTVAATRAITDMLCDGVVAFFGPEGNCLTEAIISQARNLPMISYKCSEYKTSEIPTFARTEPTDTQVTKSVISLLRYYRWQKFSILYETQFEMVALSLENHAKLFNMTVNHQRIVHNNLKCCEEKMSCCAQGFWYQLVQDTKNRTRIYVLLGTTPELHELMTAMDSMQLFLKGEYMVLFVDRDTYSTKEALKYLFKTEERGALSASCNMSAEFLRRSKSLLVVASRPPSDSYDNFTDKVLDYNARAPFNWTLPPIFDNKKKFVSIYAAYLYDAVKLYARSLHTLLGSGALSEREVHRIATNGTGIIAAMVRNTPYKSISGATIKLDESADSEGNFSVLALKPFRFDKDDDVTCQYNMVPVGYFAQANKTFPEYRPNPRLTIDWPSGVKPEDEPSCGFLDEKCPKDDSQVTSLVVAGTLALTLFCALVVTISIYRKWKIEQEIEGLLWKIDPKDIIGYFGNDIVCSPSKTSMTSMMSNESRFGAQVFASTAQYRGNVVRVKELKFNKKKDISRDVMKEMRLLRDLRHDNINSLIGACVEPARILLITDYCSKGSLYDIIENEDIKLDKMFVSSLVHDLIKGMIFIHNSLLIYHGNLKSSNCVVTSRWMLQVSDFGLHEIRLSAETESIGEHQYYRSLLWKSPELLRAASDTARPVYGTQKGDVYAFGIILYEIIARRGPFGLTALEPKEIVERVKRCAAEGSPPFRPVLAALEASPDAEEYVSACVPLLRDCWSEEPAARPDFLAVRSRLKRLKSGKHRNIMDQMMDMMEKYANNLEELVNERTSLLIEEKQKTEDLLHRMLPKSVAQRLTTGQGVEPESFDSVTIYFSDIVGFTAMSAVSTPLQVVNFLNDLYTIFDRIIRAYDVYKVETIGDAYMVVSGLPIRNNARHVGEIASMALDLLNAVKTHKLSLRSNETLKLRIGIHTGAVVAGVVGLTMPRYCLFGDTVNTASRMESTGEALRIHCSPSCKAALDALGGYVLQPRGTVAVKGKGDLQTYWLVEATERAVQRRAVELAELPPLFSQPRRSPRLAESRHASLSGAGCPGGAGSGARHSSVPRSVFGSGTLPAGGGGGGGGDGSVASLGKASPARPAKLKHASSPLSSLLRSRQPLSSIASSRTEGCGDGGGGGGGKGGGAGTLRCTRSLDVIPLQPPSRPLTIFNQRQNPLLDGYTGSGHFIGISTVSGKVPGTLYNGNIIGSSEDDRTASKQEENSPLLNKGGLYNKWEQPKKKPQDGNSVEFQKKWHSLEHVEAEKTDSAPKVSARFDLKQWLKGMWSSSHENSHTSLRRPDKLLERESVV